MGIFTKIFIWPFLCIPRVGLFITTYFGHSTTKNSLKYPIWNFAFWVDKMSQNRAIFFEIAHEHFKYNWNFLDQLLLPSKFNSAQGHTRNVLFHFCQLWAVKESVCNVLRPWQNNCLVPVTYGSESRVGRSGKYFILDKNFYVARYYQAGKMVQNSEVWHITHVHTHTERSWQHAVLSLSWAWYAAFRQFSLHFR